MSSLIEFRRDIGFFGAFTIGLGTMMGAGVFILPGIIYGDAGPASILSFLLGGLVSLLAALSLSELSTALPESGGSYHYINTALGNLVGSLSGLLLWAGLTFATSFYMLGFGEYLAYLYGDISVTVAAIIMAGFLVLVNVRGVKETGWLQNLIVTLLVGLVLVFVAFGLPQIETGNFSPFNPHGWSNVMMTIGTVYVTFIGFEVIADIAEEIKNPQKNIPLAMIASVIVPTALYSFVMFISIGILPEGFVNTFVPVATVASEYMGEIGTLAMVIGAIFATVSSANSSLLASSRINFAMGRDRILTGWVNDIHEKFRTPHKSIMMTGIFMLIIIFLEGGIGIGVDVLGKVAGFAYLVSYSLVHLSLLVMRNLGGERYDPSFRCPGYPYVQIAGFIAGVLILIQMGSTVTILGGSVVLFGLFWYFLYVEGGIEREGALEKAIESEGRLGSEDEVFKVIVALAHPKSEKELIKVASACASSHTKTEVIALHVIGVSHQLSLSHSVAFEKERIEKRKELLESARETAKSENIDLRTRVIISRDVSDTILNVVEEENADHLVLGWRGDRELKEYILGTKLDTIVEEAECEISVVKPREEDRGYGKVAGFVGEGPNTPAALRRAHELAIFEVGRKLILLNVQEIEHGDDEGKLREVGHNLIAEMAEEADIDESEYESIVILSKNRKKALLKEVDDYEIVCTGSERKKRIGKALFGSLPEEIGRKSTSTVIMVRRPMITTKSLIRKIKSFFKVR